MMADPVYRPGFNVSLFRDWMSDWGGLSIILLGAFTAGYLLWLSFSDGSFIDPIRMTEAMILPATLVMTALGWRASCQEELKARTRRAWRILALAFSAYFLSNLIWFYEGIESGISWADPIHLIFYPLLLWGVLTFPMTRITSKTRLTFVLDAGTVMIGGGMVIWYLLLRPAALVERCELWDKAVALALPVGDLVLLSSIVAILLRKPADDVQRALGILTLGIAFNAIGDLGDGYQMLHGRLSGDKWPDKFYLASFFLMALSGQYQYWTVAHGRKKTEPADPATLSFVNEHSFNWLPYLGIALGYGLLLTVVFGHSIDEDRRSIGELIIGVILLTGFVMARQITAVRENLRLLNERAAHQSEARFRSLVQHSSDVITILKPDLTISYASPSIEPVFGYAMSELTGWNFSTLLHESDRDQVDAFFAAVMQGPGVTVTGEWRLSHASGAWLQVESIGTNLLHDQNVQGLVLNFRNVTERKRAEETLRESEKQLRQAQKMEAIGALAGGIAHDFNNVLGAIVGYTELAMQDLTGQEAGQEARQEARQEPVGHHRTIRYLANVLKASNRARDLVRQILTFSRQEEGEFRPLRLQPVLKEALQLLRASIPSTIEIRQQIDSKAPPIFGDPTQIYQVVMNLCTNSWHAIGESGTIEVCLKGVEIDAEDSQLYPHLPQGQYLQLSVSDNGCGMDQEVIDRIFEPFYTTKQPGEGTGLGLSVVHGVVKRHEGAISVFSEPGHGTSFRLYFSALKSQESPESDGDHLIPRGHGERILFVDDEQLLAALSKNVLERIGYRVTVKTHSPEALEIFRAQPDRFDLVVTDQTMPVMDGVHLATELLSIRPDLPVILVTGYSAAINPESIQAIGIRELLMKPNTALSLGEAVSRALAPGRKE